jgi:5-methylcytosine-specific restriction protein A
MVSGSCPTCGNGKRESRDAAEQHRRNVTYGRRWKAFRLSYLMNYPLCVDCESEGVVRPATEVHHKRKVKEVPHLQYDHENLMGLCKRCHDERTGKGE